MDGCENEAIFDTNICDSCLEEAAIKNLQNFGMPEYYICGNCGCRVCQEEADKHFPCE